MWRREDTLPIKIGNIVIGGGNPVAVQSMTNTRTEDVPATVSQIKRLEKAGCELVRVAVPTKDSALKLGEIKKSISIPLIADLHFDLSLGFIALEMGVDKIRINPGTVPNRQILKDLVLEAKARNVPIRVGVNKGSLPDSYSKDREGLVKCALDYVKLIEDWGYTNLVVSIKSSDPEETVNANVLLASYVRYPISLGVTEAGGGWRGIVKSSIGLALALKEGIGDTVRVSLTGDPVMEVKVAYEVLRSLNLRRRGVNLIACPTCGRCQVDLESYYQEVESALENITVPIDVAVMGCSVNGPGEARLADCGVAFGKDKAVFFIKGNIIGTFSPREAIKKLISYVKEAERYKDENVTAFLLSTEGDA
ncbi:flavodoxin-dependent (E)-4-hydroxy-3-methylbut-2-enyl-diphosphate synthase [bacterium]|nr:flavodoxin-dependent (E)-4-hydroxy-3-methylbut-2-enyl-diphosphate synthase [bacterium]